MWELKQSLLQPQKALCQFLRHSGISLQPYVSNCNLPLKLPPAPVNCGALITLHLHGSRAKKLDKNVWLIISSKVVDSLFSASEVYCTLTIWHQGLFWLKLGDCDLPSGWSTSWWIANLSLSRAWLVSQVKKNIMYFSWSFRQLTLFAYLPSWESPLREADSTKVEKNSLREFGRERVVALMRLAEPPMHHASFARHQLHHHHHLHRHHHHHHHRHHHHHHHWHQYHHHHHHQHHHHNYQLHHHHHHHRYHHRLVTLIMVATNKALHCSQVSWYSPSSPLDQTQFKIWLLTTFLQVCSLPQLGNHA